eukprot:TRINITY_DN5106_c0_g3_i1.p1 TRINITY_DN5106_c0_g3~~TRINITY_DN5106_c0_g3_i1.p1  ORF type:complete len:614 (+),score=89.32 TRINITY_DN5106_c0_g3_i1:60-1901(+)
MRAKAARVAPSEADGKNDQDGLRATASNGETGEHGRTAPKDTELSWPKIIGCVVGALFFLYMFLVGLSIMGGAFKILGGRGAGNMYTAVENPIVGLMTGVVSTVLVQSSSTSTSVAVTMVGADVITVKAGIPIIMGANIGTSVTNTIIAMGWTGDRIDRARAFSGATVHDMFNMLTVLTLLPIEAIVAAIQGEGGPLYWLTYAITKTAVDGEKAVALLTSPIKTITAPVSDAVLNYALTLGMPTAKTPSVFNATACGKKSRRLAEGGNVSVQSSLLTRRSGDETSSCKEYFCVDSGQDKNFKKISLSSYKKLTKCKGYILDDNGEPCGKDKCYLDAGAYYDTKVENGELVKGGFLAGAGDVGGGIIGLLFSIGMLTMGRIGLTKTLHIVFMTKLNRIIKLSLQVSDYLAIIAGIGLTILVQSSSVVASALTPLCAIGLLPLIKMLPLTLGANIGTTCTALIASLVSLKFGAVQLALCHLWFNIIGILVWYSAPIMRSVPLRAASLLGLYASYYRYTPPLYILVMFIIMPLIFLGVSAVIDASVAGGVILFLLVLVCIAAFVFFWSIGYPMDGEHALCYRVLSKEQRKAGEEELAKANADLIADAVGADPEAPQ